MVSPVSLPVSPPLFLCWPGSTSNRTAQRRLSFPPVWPQGTELSVSLPLFLLCFKAEVLKLRRFDFVSRLEKKIFFECGILSSVSESARIILYFLVCIMCICTCLHIYVHTGLCACLWRPEDNLRFCFSGSIYPVFCLFCFVFLWWGGWFVSRQCLSLAWDQPNRLVGWPMSLRDLPVSASRAL